MFRAVRRGLLSNYSDRSNFFERLAELDNGLLPLDLSISFSNERYDLRTSSICVHTNDRSYLGMNGPCGNYSCCIPAEGGRWQGSQCIINKCRSSLQGRNTLCRRGGREMKFLLMARFPSASYSPCVSIIIFRNHYKGRQFRK